MVTRKVRAVNITTRDLLVEQGSRRREGHKICEVLVNGMTGAVDVRVRMDDGRVEHRAFDIADEIRIVAS